MMLQPQRRILVMCCEPVRCDLLEFLLGLSYYDVVMPYVHNARICLNSICMF